MLRCEAHECRHHQARDVRVLGRVPERQALGAGVVFADRRPRFDRVRHEAIVDEIELSDVSRRLECRLDSLGITEMPLVDSVARGDLMNLRRALVLCLRRIGQCRQEVIIDLDLLRGIFRLRERLGDDHSNGITHIVRLGVRDRRVWRHFHLRAVLGRDHPAANEIADLIGGKVCAGEHREHAWHRRGSLAVDVLDLGVGVRRAQEVGVALAGTAHVIRIVALAGDEALILFAANRRADSGRAHGDLLTLSLR